jgi:hypothetical protein
VIDAEVDGWLRDVFDRGRPIPTLAHAPQSCEAFRKLILSDPLLQQELHKVEAAPDLRDALSRIGNEYGFSYTGTDTASWPAIRGSSAPAAGQGDAWMPLRVSYREAKPFAEWAYFGSKRCVEPFFEDTMRLVLRNPFARAFRYESPLECATSAAPAGFIFHMSRCGATLMGQMLAALESSLVISEAPAIDDVVQADVSVPSITEGQHAGWLRAVVGAFAQYHANQERYFIKLDSWHIHKLPLIRRAFPEVPWIFLYRAPVEVLVSQLRKPGRVALPGALPLSEVGMSAEDLTALNREEWCARVLSGFCRTALSHCEDPKGLFLNYNQLPEAVWTVAKRHFGLSLDEEEAARMRSAVKFDSKNPSRPFEPDGARKQQEASSRICELAREFLEPLYQQLEVARLNGCATRLTPY